MGINFGKKMTKIVSSLKFKSQGGQKFSFFAATKTASVIWCSRHRFIDLWMTNAWNICLASLFGLFPHNGQIQNDDKIQSMLYNGPSF